MTAGTRILSRSPLLSHRRRGYQGETFQNLLSRLFLVADFESGSLSERAAVLSTPQIPIHFPTSGLDIGLYWLVDLPPRQQQSSIASYADTRVSKEETDEGVAGSERPCLSNFKPTH
jgi:hypothetical protein